MFAKKLLVFEFILKILYPFLVVIGVHFIICCIFIFIQPNIFFNYVNDIICLSINYCIFDRVYFIIVCDVYVYFLNKVLLKVKITIFH